MIEILKAILYGIVEGITEWLPISSTGHLILLESIMPFQTVAEGGSVTGEFFGMFDVVIQLGAILAVVVLFWNRIWPFALTRKEREKEGGTGVLSWLKKDIWILWFKILVSCVPAAVIGILFDDVFDALFYNPTCVAIALIVFGVAFIIVENWNRGRRPRVRELSQISYQTAFLTLRSNHCGCLAHWRVQDCGGGIYFFPGHSRDVRSQSFEGGEIRICIYFSGTDAAAHGDTGILYRLSVCAPVSDGVHQKA